MICNKMIEKSRQNSLQTYTECPIDLVPHSNFIFFYIHIFKKVRRLAQGLPDATLALSKISKMIEFLPSTK